MGASADIKKSIDVLVSKPATLAQWRLVPQDYHNIHSPVAGKVVGIHTVEGPLSPWHQMRSPQETDVSITSESTWLSTPTFPTVLTSALSALLGSVLLWWDRSSS